MRNITWQNRSMLHALSVQVDRIREILAAFFEKQSDTASERTRMNCTKYKYNADQQTERKYSSTLLFDLLKI